MNQTVSYVHPITVSNFKPLELAFEFRKDRPMKWLQRICLWTLRKLGCFAMKEIDEVSYQAFSTPKVAEIIYRQNSELLNFAHDREGEIFMGSMEFQEMMSFDIRTPLSFDIPYTAMANGRPILLGMPVTVIPWMKGVLVAPRTRGTWTHS